MHASIKVFFPILDLMNRFEQDEKDAGVHQIHLIDVRQDPGSLELVSKELNHLAAILHVYAGV